jgi:hypothetical protein
MSMFPDFVKAPPRLDIVIDDPFCISTFDRSVTMRLFILPGYGVLCPISAMKKLGACTRSGAASPLEKRHKTGLSKQAPAAREGTSDISLSTGAGEIGIPPRLLSP